MAMSMVIIVTRQSNKSRKHEKAKEQFTLFTSALASLSLPKYCDRSEKGLQRQLRLLRNTDAARRWGEGRGRGVFGGEFFRAENLLWERRLLLLLPEGVVAEYEMVWVGDGEGTGLRSERTEEIKS